MPRVTRHTSQGRAEKPVRCARCSDPIVKGEEYFKWAIKSQRGGTVYHQHTKHGPVRQSQLTHSKISGAWAAIEAAEDAIAAAGESEDVRDALNSCADDIDAVRDEYQESLDNMPEQLQDGDIGQQIQEKIEQLNSFADNLRSVDIEDFDEPDEKSSDDEESTAKADHLAEQISKAEDALGETEF